MANKALNDLYGIEFLSDWEHKDGSIYTAGLVKHLKIKDIKIPVVLYHKILTIEEREEFENKQLTNNFVRTVEHFKNSFNLLK